MSAKLSGLQREGVFQVPRIAIKGSDELLVANDDDELEIRQVGIVRSDADFAYIHIGVEAGERVVLTAIESPVNGMRLRPIEVDDQ